MKKLSTFLAETRPATTPLVPTPDASPAEKQLASKDTSQKRALNRLAKDKGVKRTDIERRLRTVGGQDEDEVANQVRKAAEFQYSTLPSGRGKSSDLKTAIDDTRKQTAKDQGKKVGQVQVSPEQEQDIVSDKTDQMLANMPLKQRMAMGARAIGATGGLDGDEARNVGFQKAVMRGAGADAPAPTKVKTGQKDPEKGKSETTIGRFPGQRHLFQPRISRDATPDIPSPEELGGNKYTDDETGRGYTHSGGKWLRDFEEDDALRLASQIRDRTQASKFAKDSEGNVISQIGIVTRGIGDQPKANRPSAEELKGISEPMIKKAVKAGEISKEDEKRAFELLDAFKEGEEDPVKAQGLAFTEYVGEEGEDHPAIKEFLSAIGNNPQDWGGRGLDENREKAAYGGNLGKAAERYRIPGAPDGVYNLAEMKKKDKNLYKQAMINRGNEVIRTYLRQGGTNAYAQWEGERSIGEMPLEHILDLAGGGFDHPSNWVFASQELNNMKSDKGGFGSAEKYVKPVVRSSAPGRGFKGAVSQMAKASKENKDALYQKYVDAAPELAMTANEYAELDNNQKLQAQRRLIKAGLSQEDAEKYLPLGVQERPGAMDSEQEYETERIDQETFNQEKDTGLNDVKVAQGLSSLDKAELTPQGAQVIKSVMKLRSAPASAALDRDDFE